MVSELKPLVKPYMTSRTFLNIPMPQDPPSLQHVDTTTERYKLGAAIRLSGNRYILSSCRGLCKCWFSRARVVNVE